MQAIEAWFVEQKRETRFLGGLELHAMALDLPKNDFRSLLKCIQSREEYIGYQITSSFKLKL